MRIVIRQRHYIYFHNKQHPKDMGAGEVEAFLNFLAIERKVSASTQSQALNALVFLYKQVLEIDIGTMSNLRKANRYKNLPTVLSQSEVKAILQRMRGRPAFMAALMYGTGLRINELITLRVRDEAFLCHAFTGSRLQHQDHPGTARAQEC